MRVCVLLWLEEGCVPSLVFKILFAFGDSQTHGQFDLDCKVKLLLFVMISCPILSNL